MLNSYSKQTSVLQYFLVTFDKLCPNTEKWPWGIKKKIKLLYLQTVGTSPLRGEIASVLKEFTFPFQGRH